MSVIGGKFATSHRPGVRPRMVREIALWWQAELARSVGGGHTPDPPPHREVIDRFGCSEEEALRGVGLGEHRHFSGVQ